MLLSTLKNLEMSLMGKYQSDTQKCPACHKSVNKKGEQMYCYHCFFGFDWNTLEIVSQPPKYTNEKESNSFMRFYVHKNQENPQSFRIPSDYHRLNMIYKTLFTLQKKLTKYRVDDVVYNEDLRNSLLKGEITDEEFTSELEKRLVEMNIKREVYEILKNYLVEAFKCIYSFVEFWRECRNKWNMAWIYSPMYKNFNEILKTTEENLKKYPQYEFDLVDEYYM